MIRRVAIAGIIGFWLLMNGMLVRLWLHPETSDILAIPAAHVLKQVFLHEQPSNLAISQNGSRVGGVVIRPRRSEAEGLRTVDFTGTYLLKLPMMRPQAYSWHGTVEMDRTFALRDFKLHVESRMASAEAIAIEVQVQPVEKKLSYSVKQGQAPVLEATVTLDEAGARSTLHALGIDPNIVGQFSADAATMAGQFKLVARQAQLSIRGDRIEVFRLILTQGATPMVQADISQLGQVLRIKTAFGIQLAPDDIGKYEL